MGQWSHRLRGAVWRDRKAPWGLGAEGVGGGEGRSSADVISTELLCREQMEGGGSREGEDKYDGGKGVAMMVVRGSGCGEEDGTPDPLPTHVGDSCRLRGPVDAGQEVEESPPTSWLPKSQMRKWKLSRAWLTSSLSLGSVLFLLPTGLGTPGRLDGQTDGRMEARRESRVLTGHKTHPISVPPVCNRLCYSYPEGH